MAVVWTGVARGSRERLTRALAANDPQAARRQVAAINALVATLDGVASYRMVEGVGRVVPVSGFPLVVIYDRDPATGDALVLDVVPARSDWMPAQ